MKVCLQWAKMTPDDYAELDSSVWEDTAKRPVPDTGEKGAEDETPGWVFDINIQGLCFGGADHYAVEDLNDGSDGIRVTVWNDDPDDLASEDFYAEVWTMLPLAPDPALGNGINTVQSRVVYAASAAFERWNSYPKQNTVVRPWSEFVPPADSITRHGVWVEDTKATEHETAQTPQGWRDWGEHLAASELDANGRVKTQRPQGKYNKPPGTITFFLYDNALANGIHTADFELDADEVDIASQVGQAASIANGATEQTHVWVSVSGKPGQSDWPNGAYRVQVDVQTAMNVAGFGFLTINSVAGHMARVNTGITSDLESWEQDESAFTGTGISLATHTIDPASGGTSDRYEALCVCENSSGSMTATLTIRADDSDSFMDGPWTVGPTDIPLTLADDINA